MTTLETLLRAATVLATVWLVWAVTGRLYDWWRAFRQRNELTRHLAEVEYRKRTGRLL